MEQKQGVSNRDIDQVPKPLESDTKENGRKSKCSKLSKLETGKLQHLKLRFPKSEGPADFETDPGIVNRTQEWPNLAEEENAPASWEADTRRPIYGDKPIYDEAPGEGQDYWPEHEFILAALKGDDSNSSQTLQSAFCTSERLEIYDLRNKPNKVLEDGDKPKLVDYNGEEQQGTGEEEHSVIFTNMRKELTEEVPSRDSQTAANSSGLDKRSSYLQRNDMIIFDPGGLVQEDHSKGVNHNSKDMIRSEMQVEEAVINCSVGSNLRHWQDMDFLAIEQQLLKVSFQLQRKVFIIEIEISSGLQGQDQNMQKESVEFDRIVGEINQQFVDYVRTGMTALPYQYKYMVLGQGKYENYKLMGPAYGEVSRKFVTTYIFDPGGDSSCLLGVLLVSVGSSSHVARLVTCCKER